MWFILFMALSCTYNLVWLSLMWASRLQLSCQICGQVWKSLGTFDNYPKILYYKFYVWDLLSTCQFCTFLFSFPSKIVLISTAALWRSESVGARREPGSIVMGPSTYIPRSIHIPRHHHHSNHHFPMVFSAQIDIGTRPKSLSGRDIIFY